MKLADTHVETVQTPYGEAEVEIGFLAGSMDTNPLNRKHVVAFLKRHGSAHRVPPHLINYRANIMALKQLGVRKILATAAAGSLSTIHLPGDLVLLSQFIDFTKNRLSTYFEGGTGVLHVDMTEPYCPEFAREIRTGAEMAGIPLSENGIYICTEGPRFETPAEIRMYASWGATLVGMTGVPEVVLARELGLCYNSVCLVTNWAAGLTGTPLTHEEVLQSGAQAQQQIIRLIEAVLETAHPKQSCSCPQSASEAGFFMMDTMEKKEPQTP